MLVVFAAPTVVEESSLHPDTSGVANTFLIYNPCMIISQLVDMRGGHIDSVDVYVKEEEATGVGGLSNKIFV